MSTTVRDRRPQEPVSAVHTKAVVNTLAIATPAAPARAASQPPDDSPPTGYDPTTTSDKARRTLRSRGKCSAKRLAHPGSPVASSHHLSRLTLQIPGWRSTVTTSGPSSAPFPGTRRFQPAREAGSPSSWMGYGKDTRRPDRMQLIGSECDVLDRAASRCRDLFALAVGPARMHSLGGRTAGEGSRTCTPIAWPLSGPAGGGHSSSALSWRSFKGVAFWPRGLPQIMCPLWGC